MGQGGNTGQFAMEKYDEYNGAFVTEYRSPGRSCDFERAVEQRMQEISAISFFIATVDSV